MDKPRSIKLFSLFFWLGVALDALGILLFWDRNFGENFGDDAVQLGFEFEAGFVIGVILALMVVYGLFAFLWFCIAEWRSKIAKWVLTALTALIALGTWTDFSYTALDEQVFYLISTSLSVAAIAFLFTPAARDWFNRVQSAPTDVFE